MNKQKYHSDYKMKCSQTEMPERTNKDTFSRLVSMFEVARPRKSPNSTLKKSKSVSSLLSAFSSDEDEIMKNEKLFDSTSKGKTKRRTRSIRSYVHDDRYDSKIKRIINDIELTNKQVQDFGETLRLKRQSKEHLKYKSNEKINDIVNDEVSVSQSLDRRLYRKDGKKHSSDSICRGLISRKRSKEKKESQSFKHAKNSDDIEHYRKNLVQQIDIEMEKLKIDGFLDEHGNNFDEFFGESTYETAYEETKASYSVQKNTMKSTWAERLNSRRLSNQLVNNKEDCLVKPAEIKNVDDEKEVRCYSVNNEETHTNNIPITDESSDDEFGESLADDLEANGSYFVEAYNDEGRELIIVELAVERKVIDLTTLETLNQSIENSDIVFQQNEDNTLNIIENPKEFVSAESVSSGFVTGPESNRSTLYSVRSSGVFESDDEETLNGDDQQQEDNVYSNCRRETFCDIKGVVRIERVGYPENDHGDDGAEVQPPVGRNDSFTQRGTLSYIIDEIKTTEKNYVEDLNRVVTKYIPYFDTHTPSHLIGRQCYIFGNIEKIYAKQKEFLIALENCGDTIEEIVKVFIDFERLFKLYPKYFKNKLRADNLLKEFSEVVKQSQIQFDERLDLSSYLLKPLQRLGKYKLFLENIEKQLKKLNQPTGAVEMALEIIKKEMSKGNDFVAIESIADSPIERTSYGSFIMREKFNLLKPRRCEVMVFLFENIIVLTTYDSRNLDTYVHYAHIRMSDLRIASFEDLTIHLTDFTNSKKMTKADKYTYVLEAKSRKNKEMWRKSIETILWRQLREVKENTLKLYQSYRDINKYEKRKSIKSTGSSTFYTD